MENPRTKAFRGPHSLCPLQLDPLAPKRQHTAVSLLSTTTASSPVPTMASNNAPAGEVPRMRDQAVTLGNFVAQHIKETVQDAEKREALLADMKMHLAHLTAVTKEHVSDAEKRTQLMDMAKGFAAQATAAAKDPNTRASLLDKLKATVAAAQEAVQDPAKRQEIHDQLAATTHKLLQQAQTAAPTNAGKQTPVA
jgi:hypothetical protein